MRTTIDYFLYDHLRADGWMVRWARLEMHEANNITLLCWAMEAFFALAYFTDYKRAYAVLFWVAYLAINVSI